MLKNKLGIKNQIELADVEEKITKKKALELFETKKLSNIEVGTFKGLAKIYMNLQEKLEMKIYQKVILDLHQQCT